MRRILVVLASVTVACGGLLGLGADDEDTPLDPLAADASGDARGDGFANDGDTTIPVDGRDAGDGGPRDASDGDVRDAGSTPPACLGDAGCVRYVFVTSSVHLGTLLGLGGGDTICNQKKLSNPLLADRKFVPWLSTQATDAKDRFAATAPIRRVDGVQIATGLADLLQNGPAVAINRDENGALVTNTDAVFTGTQNDGVVNNNCEDWSNAGSPAKVGSALAAKSPTWTDDGTLLCSEKARIYCVEY